MQTNLLKRICKKNQLSYIIFDTNFHVVETQDIDIRIGSNIEEFLWEIVGLQESILALSAQDEAIEIPMILRDGIYYDLEIDLLDIHNQQHFIAIIQKKSKQIEAYANVIQEINHKTLIYETSDAKRANDAYKLINKRLLMLHVTLQGTITMVNDACSHFFNLEKESMYEKHFSEFFHTQKSQLDKTTNIFIAKNSQKEDIFFHAEIIPLTNSSEEVIENIIIAQDISHLKRIKKELEYAQEHDTLTGLPNRHTFLKEIDILIEQKSSFCIAFINIDNFRTINEEYGSHAGDMLLKHLSTLINEFIEQEDILTRIYADNFAIIFEAKKSKKYLEVIMKELEKLASYNPLYYTKDDIIEFTYTTLKLCYPQDITDAKEFLTHCEKEIQRRKIKKAHLKS
jgi:diguanylate cyclase (GGDEF)-like protein